jgi:hypothetical protein
MRPPQSRDVEDELSVDLRDRWQDGEVRGTALHAVQYHVTVTDHGPDLARQVVIDDQALCSLVAR